MIDKVAAKTVQVLATPVMDLLPLPPFVRRLFAKPRIVHQTFFGPRPYLITENHPEFTRQWVKEIRELFRALKKNDWERAQKLLQGGNFHKKVADVYGSLEREGLVGDRHLILASVGLWVQKNQDKWVGTMVVVRRIVKGGSFDLTEFLKPGGQPSCLDTAVLVEVLARGCGIEGMVRKTPSPYGHRYYQAETGEVVDCLWGSWRAGLFRDEGDFRHLTNHKFLRYKVRKFTIEVVSRLLFRFVNS